jgi:hypothetical protein
MQAWWGNRVGMWAYVWLGRGRVCNGAMGVHSDCLQQGTLSQQPLSRMSCVCQKKEVCVCIHVCV